jgi:hypothetical protein
MFIVRNAWNAWINSAAKYLAWNVITNGIQNYHWAINGQKFIGDKKGDRKAAGVASQIRPSSLLFKFLGFFTKFRKATIRFVMSLCPSACNNSVPTGRISMKFHIWVFLKNLSRKFKFNYDRKIILGILHEDQYTIFIISRSILLRMRNVLNEICTENQNTHFMFNNVF